MLRRFDRILPDFADFCFGITKPQSAKPQTICGKLLFFADFCDLFRIFADCCGFLRFFNGILRNFAESLNPNRLNPNRLTADFVFGAQGKKMQHPSPQYPAGVPTVDVLAYVTDSMTYDTFGNG